MQIASCETGHTSDEFLKTCLNVECIIICCMKNVTCAKDAFNQGSSIFHPQSIESETPTLRHRAPTLFREPWKDLRMRFKKHENSFFILKCINYFHCDKLKKPNAFYFITCFRFSVILINSKPYNLLFSKYQLARVVETSPRE